MPVDVPSNTTRPDIVLGSGGGNNAYRYEIDNPNFTSPTDTTATSFTPANDLALGAHTLYVSESDAADNWSPLGAWTVFIEEATADDGGGGCVPGGEAGAAMAMLCALLATVLCARTSDRRARARGRADVRA